LQRLPFQPDALILVAELEAAAIDGEIAELIGRSIRRTAFARAREISRNSRLARKLYNCI